MSRGLVKIGDYLITSAQPEPAFMSWTNGIVTAKAVGETPLTIHQATSASAPNVADCSYMFYESTNLTAVDLSNCPNLGNGQYMFNGCNYLTEADLSNCSNLSNGSYMFYNCMSLTDADLSNCPNLSNGDHMFGGCTNLTAADLSNCPNLSNGYWMFYRTNLTAADLSNCSNLSNGRGMFQSCAALKDITGWTSLASLTTATQMLTGCTSYTGSIIQAINDLSAAGAPVCTGSNSNHSKMFGGCTAASDWAQATATYPTWTVQ